MGRQRPPAQALHPPLFLQTSREPARPNTRPDGVLGRWTTSPCLSWAGRRGASHLHQQQIPPCSLGAALGDTGLCWVGMQSPGEILRSVTKVPSPNGWQVALLAARPKRWTNSLGTCMQLCDALAASRGQEALGMVTSWCQRLFCMAVASQEDQEAPSLPLQSLSHLQEPVGGCVVPVPNHGPAKRRTRVSPARTHAAPRWVPTCRVPGRARPRLTPGTRKPRNGVKNLNLNIQNLNLGFARSCKVRGCLEGVKGREGHGQAPSCWQGQMSPRGTALAGRPFPIPCRHPCLAFAGKTWSKNGILGTDARAWGEGSDCKGEGAASRAVQEPGKEPASARAGTELLSCPSHVPCQHCLMTAMRARYGHSI